MRRNSTQSWPCLFVIAVALAALPALSPDALACAVQTAGAPAVGEISVPSGDHAATGLHDPSCLPETQAEDVGVDRASLDAIPTAGSSKCCDPTKEPGVGGNPLCFEGHTCCADGQWRCNNPDATPSCPSGQVCGAACGLSGASCNVGSDCCSGSCKGNHRCK